MNQNEPSTKGCENLFREYLKEPGLQRAFDEFNRCFYTLDTYSKKIRKDGKDESVRRSEEFMRLLEGYDYSWHKPTVFRVALLGMCLGEEWRSTGVLCKIADDTPSTVLPAMHYLMAIEDADRKILPDGKPYHGSYAWRKRNKLNEMVDQVLSDAEFVGLKEKLVDFVDERVLNVLNGDKSIIGITIGEEKCYGYPGESSVFKRNEKVLYHPHKKCVA